MADPEEELDRICDLFATDPGKGFMVVRLLISDRNTNVERVRELEEFLVSARRDLVDGDFDFLIDWIDKLLKGAKGDH